CASRSSSGWSNWYFDIW
nr:immunoglobulin heavy chain junction region [Macaca mulatta]